MTLKDSMQTVVLAFIAVCVAMPFFFEVDRRIDAPVPRHYASQTSGEVYTLFLNNYATTLTVFTEHGKPLIMDIERVRCEKTSVKFQEAELKK